VTGAGALPDYVRILFWDVEPDTVEFDRHRDYVMERVMSRGGWDAMRWLKRTYEKRALAEFVSRRGTRLSPRERAYWSLVTSDARPADEPGGGRPRWAST